MSTSEKDPIRRIRELVGRDLSDAGLAKKLGIGRSTISQWKTRGLPDAVERLLPFISSAIHSNPSDPITARLPDLEASTQTLVRLTHDAGGDPIPADLRAALVPEPSELDAPAEDLVRVRRPDPADLRLAAGSGAAVDREEVTDYVAFRRSWLRRCHLRPQDLVLIDVWGESMVPTIEDGDVALVDESHDRPRSGRIYALRTPDGLLVKRLRKRERQWWADSDNPGHSSRELGDGDEILGRVVWWAHTEAR